MNYFKILLSISFVLISLAGITQSFITAEDNIQLAQTHQRSIQKMNNLLDAYNSYGRLSGSILFTHKGHSILERSFGMASYQTNKPNMPHTSFDIGSLSKQFTAAAILSLVQQSKVNLETPINEYLGKYASKRWKKVTVHHLLTHTSGIPSLYQSGQGLDTLMPKAHPIELETLISYFKDHKLLSKPGKKYRYNNSGYILLAAIIEEVSGFPYGEYLTQTFFKPLNMQETFWINARSASVADGYLGFHEARIPATKWSPTWAIGAGGWHSAVMDLEKWRKYINSEDFLTPALVKKYYYPHVSTRSGHYAYGWEVKKFKGFQMISHDGATLGFVSQFIQIPAEEIGVFILLNQTHDLDLLGTSEQFAEDIGMDLISLFYGSEENVSLIPSKIELSANDLQKKEGTYNFSEEETWKIAMKEGRLFIDANNYSPIQLLYYQDISNSLQVAQSSYAIAEALKTNKIGKMAPHSDATMKILTWLGIMKLGYNSIIGDRKEMLDYHIYQLEDMENNKHKVTIRTIFEQDQIDFALYFNEKDKLQGIFDAGYYSPGPQNMSLIPVSANEFILDGFTYGEKDLIVRFNHQGLVLGEDITAIKE